MTRACAVRLCACWAALALALASTAAAQSKYTGQYVASPARVEANVSEWGPDCGARPQSYTAKESAHLEVREQSGHLSLLFAQRTLRTNACWSPNPTVKLVSTSSSSGRWRTECRTPQGEPRKESGRYTVTAQAGGSLELMEESEYDWRLEQSHCAAHVRITQRLERRTAANSKLVGAQKPEPTCVAGDITRIRLRPLEAKLTPGGRACFQVRGFDSEGCEGDVDASTLRWDLKKAPATRGTLTAGCFKAADSAADAEGTFQVSVLSGSMHAEATVTVEAADLSDITARRSATKSRVGEAQPVLEGELTGAGVKAVGVDSRRRWGPIVLIAALAMALAAGGATWMLRRKQQAARLAAQAQAQAAAAKAQKERDKEREREAQRSRQEREAAAPVVSPRETTQAATQLGSPAYGSAPGETLPSTPPQAPDPRDGAMICPTCRRGYAPGSAECTSDGTPLMLYAEFVRRAKEQKSVICAACGARLAAGAAFCGECGKKLQA